MSTEERCHELDEKLDQYNPARDCFCNSLRAVPTHEMHVVLVDQIPYPNRLHANGIELRIPEAVIYTRVNDHLCKLGQKPIDWRLK